MIQTHKQLRWVIWALAIAFYFYEFFLRVAPSVIVDDLVKAFHIDAAMVGSLVAGYLYVYAPMQIPVGLLMDRFGARRLLTLGTISCGIGSLIFGLGEDYYVALLGRCFMGFGSSFAFVGMVYVASHWFPSPLLPLLVGIGNSFGMMGALWGEDVLGLAITHFSWRTISIFLGVVGIFLGVFIYTLFIWISSDIQPKRRREEKFVKVWSNLKLVCFNPQTWINATVSLLMYATTTAFAGLWGINFIKSAYSYDVTSAAFVISLVFLGWIVGGPIQGYIAERFISRKKLLIVSSLLAFACLTPFIYYTGLGELQLSILSFLVGVFSSAQLLTFSYAIEINPRKAKGTALAFTNFIVMVAAAVLQPFVGFLLDIESYEVWKEGAVSLTTGEYQVALFCFPLSFLLAAIVAFWLKSEEEISLDA